MANTPSPAPAGAGSDQAPSSVMSILDMAGDEDANARHGAPAGGDDDEAPAATAQIEDDEAPAGDLDEAEIEPEGEEQAPDPESEPETEGEPKAEKPKAKVDLNDDDAVTHLRDNTPVTVKALKETFERHRDLETRILPAVQTEYQRLERETQTLRQSQQQLQPVLQSVAAVLQRRLPPEPSPDLLDPMKPTYDPIEYSRQRDIRALAVAEVQEVERVRAEQERASVQQAQEQRAAFVRHQQALLGQRMPHLRDPKVREEFQRGMQEVGSLAGFSQEELGEIYDHRLFPVIELAIKGLRADREAQERATRQQEQARQAAAKVRTVPPAPPKAAAPVPPKPPVAAPAARTAPSTRADVSARASLERLRKSGSARDADDFFSRFA